MSDPLHRLPFGIWALCVWLSVVALPIGSNRPWALGITLPCLLLIAVAVCWQTPRATGSPVPAWMSYGPTLLLAVFLGLIVLQRLPLGGAPHSVIPARTSIYLLQAAGCAVTFWLVIALADSSAKLRLLMHGIVAAGLVQALLAIYLLAADHYIVVLDNELGITDYATGTFQNRNHLAAFLNLSLASGIGLLMARLTRHPTQRNWRQLARDGLGLLLGSRGRLRLLLTLMVIVLIATRSRMGNAAFLAGLMCAALTFAAFTPGRRRSIGILLASLLVVDLALVGTWVGLDKVVERLSSTALASTETTSRTPAPAEESLQQRILPAIDGLGIVREHPLLGTGGGTFFVTYMAHARADRGFFNHAHNDYLEIAADTGLIGLAALGSLALLSLAACLHVLRGRRNRTARAAAFAALMGIVCIGLHSFVEFNLQIPAVAMLFSAIVALPFAAARLPQRQPDNALTPVAPTPFAAATMRPASMPAALRPPTPRRSRVLPALATVAMAWLAFTAGRFGWADLVYNEASAQLTAWEQGGSHLTASDFTRLQARLKRAIDLSPESPEYHEAMGDALFARAMASADADQPASAGQPPSADHLRRSLDSYRRALEHNRVSPYTWGSLLVVKAHLDEHDEEFETALLNAARFGPFEPNVQVMVLDAGLQAWDRLSLESRRRIARLVRDGWAGNARRLAEQARNSRRPYLWCDLSEHQRPMVESPPDVDRVMMALCEAAAAVDKDLHEKMNSPSWDSGVSRKEE